MLDYQINKIDSKMSARQQPFARISPAAFLSSYGTIRKIFLRIH